MAEYDNSNSGAIFVNDRRTKPNHPNFKGSCTIRTPDGELVEYWVSGWEKSGKKGPFVSLAFEQKEKEEKTVSSGQSSFLSGGTKAEEPAKPKTTIQEDLSDDLPF
jgi:hypothetical protein